MCREGPAHPHLLPRADEDLHDLAGHGRHDGQLPGAHRGGGGAGGARGGLSGHIA